MAYSNHNLQIVDTFAELNAGMIKSNVNRLSLQFVTSTELAVMCVCHYGFEVRYINI